MKKNRLLLFFPVLLTCLLLIGGNLRAEEQKELPKNIDVQITSKARPSEIGQIVVKVINNNGYTIKDITVEISGKDDDSLSPFVRFEGAPVNVTVAEMIADKKNKSVTYPLEVPSETSIGTYELKWIVGYKDLYGDQQTVSESFYMEVLKPNPVIGPFRMLLDQFAGWFGNYGWAVIILALLIKLIMYPLNVSSMKSQAQMQSIQPKVAEINKLYKDNQQKKSEEMMKLYKEEKINPAAGCLPMLPQLAVLYLLYGALQGYTPLYQSSFLWLDSLGKPDPYYIFPILAGVSTFLQSVTSGQSKDPQTKTMTYMMPLFFFFIMRTFPAALAIFWTAFGVMSWGQQYLYNKSKKTNTKLPVTVIKGR